MLPTGYGWASDVFVIVFTFAASASLYWLTRERVLDRRHFTARVESEPRR